MTPSISTSTLEALCAVCRDTPGLEVLLLFGSRARGDARANSDWDFGYLSTEALNPAALLGVIVQSTGSDHVDLVDLRRGSGLVRYRAARDGQLIYEARPGLADAFRLEAALFWCDAAPILQRGYDDVLAGLKP